jgi:hypothetical protein
MKRRGRPPNDDLLVRELAIALEVARGLGPQKARDLALAVFEGRPAWPTKATSRAKRSRRKLGYLVIGRQYRVRVRALGDRIWVSPRGSRKAPAGSKMTSFKVSGIEGRERTIARKIKRGEGVRRDVVKAFADLLRAKDEDLLRCLRALVDALKAWTVA